MDRLGGLRGSDSLRLVRTLALFTLAAEMVILAASGIWLALNYRPVASTSRSDRRLLQRSLLQVLDIRTMHRFVGHLAVWTALGACVLVIADAVVRAPGRRRVAHLVVGPGLLITVLSASFTGYLLPWDQLALWAVTVGTNIKGYGPVFGSQARFVLLGGVEISKATLWRWFIIHTVVLTIVFLALLLIAMRVKPTGRVHAALSSNRVDGRPDCLKSNLHR